MSTRDESEIAHANRVAAEAPPRICAHPGCERKLSIYNHTDQCKTHGELRVNADGSFPRRSTRDGV